MEDARSAVAERATARDVRIAVTGDARALVDRDRCVQIFINLLDNAIRHSPRGSRVRVRVDRQPRGHAIVSVADSGPGFSREVIEADGRPFAAGRDGNVGLGLAIARLLAVAHGGALTIGKGSGGGMVSVTFSDARAPTDKNPAGPNTRL